MKIRFWMTALAAVLTLSLSAYEITHFGAVGDGKTDNSEAFERAVAQIAAESGGELHFPRGSYRFARVGSAALHFNGVSNVTLRFDAGAEILMDNLQPDGSGAGHGVVFTGFAENITLDSVSVRWARQPSQRSWGDAFRFEGYPSEEETIRNIVFRNCRAENSPQTGAVFMGCSDIAVLDFAMAHTLADGLHFNACRRVNVNGVNGVDVGDDTLAFVTYYSEEAAGEKGGVPFSFPELGEWNNTDSNAVNITANGGRADGIRVSGAWNLNISNVVVRNKWGGIQLDSARKTEDGQVGWSYLLSKRINISNVVIDDCEWGLIIRTLNIAPDAPRSFWEGDIAVNNATIAGCSNFGVDVQSCAGVNLTQIRCDSPVRLLNNRGRWLLRDWYVKGVPFAIHGVQDAQANGYARNYEPLPRTYTALSEVSDGELVLNGIHLEEVDFSVTGFGKLRGDHVAVSGGKTVFEFVRDLQIGDMETVDGKMDLVIQGQEK